VAVRPPENELLFVMPACLTDRVNHYLARMPARQHADELPA
jgi:hypothetical protein